MAFVRFRVDEHVWLSACDRCSQLISFAENECELGAAEEKHSCQMENAENGQFAENSDCK